MTTTDALRTAREAACEDYRSKYARYSYRNPLSVQRYVDGHWFLYMPECSDQTERPQPPSPDQHAGANAAGQGLSAREAEQFAIGYYFSCAGFPRIAPHDEPTKARDAWLSGWDVAKLVGQGGDAKAVEQRRIPQFCGGAWMDYFEQARLVDGTSGNVIDDMQHAFDAGWQAATAALAQSDATAPLNSLLHLEPWRITRRPGGLHIACSGTAQTDAILAALGGV